MASKKSAKKNQDADEPSTLAAATEAVGTAVGRAVGRVQRVVKSAAGRLTAGPATKSLSKSTKRNAGKRRRETARGKKK